MRMKIETVVLQEVLSKAIKGCGNNKMLPITSLLCVSLSEKTLTMQTTDAENYLYAYAKNIEGDDFYVVVEADKFYKLVSKFTCEFVEMSVDNKVLNVKGNGTYKIELPLDENGSTITFPNPLGDKSILSGDTLVKTFTLNDIKSILNANKSALSTELDIPCYTAYYVDNESVISTDTSRVCENRVSIIDEPTLISAETMNLLDVINTNDISVYVCVNTIVFESDDVLIYTTKVDGIEDYQIDAISGLLDESFNNTCKVVKSALLSALDRLSLFIGAFDNNSVSLVFDSNQISISSRQSDAVETISYNECTGGAKFICNIDITMLQLPIKANTGEFVTIHYGNDTALKITDGNVTHVIAFMEE